MNTILQLFFSPARAFDKLKQENKFPVMTLIVLLLIYLINMILMIPVMSKVMEITLSSMPLPEGQLDTTLQIMHKMRYLQIIGTVFVAATTLFVFAFLLYIITLIAKPTLKYVQSFTIIIYSYFAVVVGNLINTGLLYWRGLEEIKNPYEVAATGLNLLTSVEKSGATVYTFLGLVNPFEAWFIVLISIGLKIFAGIKYAKALILSVIFWLIVTLYPVLSVFFSEMFLKKSGITL